MERPGTGLGGWLTLASLLFCCAAVFIPRFLKADTVEDVARQRLHLNVVSQGLQAYALEEEQLPPWFMAYDPPPNMPANSQFPSEYLTTPVDYIEGRLEVFTHEMAPDKGGPQWERLQGQPGATCAQGRPFRVAKACSNSDFTSRTRGYLHCPDFEGLIEAEHAYVLWGAGPTGRIMGTGKCSRFSPETNDTPYDPTNGAVSNGHIYLAGFMPTIQDRTVRFSREEMARATARPVRDQAGTAGNAPPVVPPDVSGLLVYTVFGLVLFAGVAVMVWRMAR